VATLPRLGVVLVVPALLLLLPLCTQHAAAATVAGVDVPGTPVDPAVPGPPATPRAAEVLIDFDDVPAPCVFMSTSALRDHYLAFGVSFLGTGPNDGGAILNACSNFSVGGYSGVNFFAFNAGASYPAGGIPRLPEAIVFTSPVVAVSILVGSGLAGGSATMSAYDAANNLVASSSRSVGPTLAPLSVTATSIQRVILGGPTPIVFDDLRFTPGGIVPTTSSSWARLKALYR
jgi:hypothetical protein